MKLTHISFIFFSIIALSQSTYFGSSNLASNFFNLFTKYWGIDQQKIPSKTLIPNVNRNAPPQAEPKALKNFQDSSNIQVSNKSSLVDPVNRIEDGKLSNVKIGSQSDNQQWTYVNGKIGNWEVEKGEIGNGKFYNIGWNESSKVLQLDSDQNQVYKYILNLNGGLYQVNFDWAARQQQPLETSQFIVRFNGEDITQIKADNFDINHFKKQVSTFRGNNEFKLIGSGPSDGYGITVGNFAIYKSYEDPTQPGFLANKQDLPITYVPNDVLPFSKINNYLTNGDFQLSRIPNGERFYLTSKIPSWLVNKGQLGVGEYYNINWAPRTQLIHLDIGKNLNYLNRVSLGKGRFELSFDWAAKDGKRYDTSQFILRFNNKHMKTLKPWDYYCHRYSVIVDSNEGINTIELAGAGPIDNFGATIDNVVLRDYYGH